MRRGGVPDADAREQGVHAIHVITDKRVERLEPVASVAGPPLGPPGSERGRERHELSGLELAMDGSDCPTSSCGETKDDVTTSLPSGSFLRLVSRVIGASTSSNSSSG
jgi:hypothetical protein